MPLTKAQIIERIKAKSPNANLSKVRLDAMAAKFEGKHETTEELDEKLDELNEVMPFTEIAKQDDQVRTLEAKVKAPIKTEEEPTVETPAKEDDDTPAWAKSLIESNKALQTEIATIKEGKTIDTRKSTLEKKLADVSEEERNKTLRAFGRMKFETDEEFDEYLEEVDTDVANYIQATADAGAGDYVPAGGARGVKLKEEEVSPAMKEVIADRKAAAEAAARTA